MYSGRDMPASITFPVNEVSSTLSKKKPLIVMHLICFITHLHIRDMYFQDFVLIIVPMAEASNPWLKCVIKYSNSISNPALRSKRHKHLPRYCEQLSSWDLIPSHQSFHGALEGLITHRKTYQISFSYVKVFHILLYVSEFRQSRFSQLGCCRFMCSGSSSLSTQCIFHSAGQMLEMYTHNIHRIQIPKCRHQHTTTWM